MPTFHSTSRLKASSELWDASLAIRHVIIAGKSSFPSTLFKHPSSLAFDVSPPPSFALVLDGKVNGDTISSQDVKASGMAKFIRSCFEEMADELGLTGVSKWYIDEKDDGKPKLLLHCLYRPLDTKPKVKLNRIHLTFNWSNSSSSLDDDGSSTDPFSSSLYMPLQTLLSGLIDRFMSTQLAMRYPLIFGRLREKLDDETRYFTPFISSLGKIIDTSEDDSFRSQCERYIRKIAHQRTEYIEDKESKLRCNTNDEDVSEEDVLSWALQRLFVTGTKRVPLKKLKYARDVTCEVMKSDNVETETPSSQTFAEDSEEGVSLDWSDVSSDEEIQPATSEATSPELIPMIFDEIWEGGDIEEMDLRTDILVLPELDTKREGGMTWDEPWLASDDDNSDGLVSEAESNDLSWVFDGGSEDMNLHGPEILWED